VRGAITESALLLNEDEDHAERGLHAISELCCLFNQWPCLIPNENVVYVSESSIDIVTSVVNIYLQRNRVQYLTLADVGLINNVRLTAVDEINNNIIGYCQISAVIFATLILTDFRVAFSIL